MSLENAPDEVKLAVDLIMLLENHDIPAETVLKALEIVQRDFEGKVKASSPHPNPLPQGEENRLSRSGIVTFNFALHFRMLITFFVTQVNFKLVEGDINIVFTAQTIDRPVKLIYRVATVTQFTHV